MSSSSSPKATIAIFGATGGTGLSVLHNCLKAGHTVNVLARTPSKLGALSSKHPNLHITQGDIHDITAVKETLLHHNRAVDVVVSAIGMIAHREGLSIAWPDKHICEAGTRQILTAVAELEAETQAAHEMAVGGPTLVLLSTTGISSKCRDVPLAVVLPYALLSVPHTDKKKMEQLVIASGRRWVLVRPSLLLDGEAKGRESVRFGIENPADVQEGQPAVGYSIRREDVGGWIYEECIKGSGEEWMGKCVSLTY